MKALDDRRFRLGFAVVALFTVLAGDAWRYSLSWYGFGVIAIVLSVIGVLLLVRNRDSWRISRLPYPLLAFLALATVSVAWSFYPGATLLGLFVTYLTVIIGLTLAVILSWHDVLLVLGRTLRIIIGLSLLFELVVSVILRSPLLPFWPSPGIDYSNLPDKIPKLLFWSRNELFVDGGKIQGIVGNSSLLAQAALLGLIVFGIQLAARSVGRAGWVWLAVALVAIGLTRSATIFLAIAALLVVTLAVVLVRRARTPRERAGTYGGIVAVVVVLVAGAIASQRVILSLLGKNSELTGRTEIWQHVIHTWLERPAFGWGWISYWVPWAYPFTDKKLLYVEAGGVQVLHAHDAWLDVLFQLGVVGLVVFAALVLSTLWRSWQLAVDRSFTGPKDSGSYSWLSLLPLLVLVAQLIQSIAESRILVEGGWLLLILWAVKTKWDRSVPELLEGRPRRAG